MTTRRKPEAGPEPDAKIRRVWKRGGTDKANI